MTGCHTHQLVVLVELAVGVTVHRRLELIKVHFFAVEVYDDLFVLLALLLTY